MNINMNIKNVLNNVFVFTAPIIILVIVIYITFRIIYLITKKEHVYVYKEIIYVLLIMYVLCLFQIVSFQDSSSIGTNNFIAFREILRYDISSKYFVKNVIGNVIMFIPYGFFISYFFKSKKIYIPFIMSFVASISIEIMQKYIGRVFDIDDIILNCFGGILGFLLYYVCRKVLYKLPKSFRSEFFLNLYSIIFGVCFILVIIGVIL